MASTGTIGSVHATQVLREEVFAVEVVVVGGRRIVGVGGGCAEVAAPEAKFDVLSANVPLPLVLRGESGSAVVDGEWAWEGPSVVLVRIFGFYFGSTARSSALLGGACQAYHGIFARVATSS